MPLILQPLLELAEAALRGRESLAKAERTLIARVGAIALPSFMATAALGVFLASSTLIAIGLLPLALVCLLASFGALRSPRRLRLGLGSLLFGAALLGYVTLIALPTDWAPPSVVQRVWLADVIVAFAGLAALAWSRLGSEQA